MEEDAGPIHIRRVRLAAAAAFFLLVEYSAYVLWRVSYLTQKNGGALSELPPSPLPKLLLAALLVSPFIGLRVAPKSKSVYERIWVPLSSAGKSFWITFGFFAIAKVLARTDYWLAIGDLVIVGLLAPTAVSLDHEERKLERAHSVKKARSPNKKSNGPL